MKQQIIALPQTTITVGDEEYLVTALSATEALQFQEKQLQQMVDADQGKAKVDLTDIKKIVCKCVSKDNMQITEKTFDIIFARRTSHLQELFSEILEYNFPKEESDSEV